MVTSRLKHVWVGGGKWSLKIWQEIVIKITSSTRPKIEAYVSIVHAALVQRKCMWAGIKGSVGEKQLIDLEWPTSGVDKGKEYNDIQSQFDVKGC